MIEAISCETLPKKEKKKRKANDNVNMKIKFSQQLQIHIRIHHNDWRFLSDDITFHIP